MNYITVPFDKIYQRVNFCCGKPSLDDYLKTQVSQDIRKMLAVCFVLLDENKESIIAYYTLSSSSIPYSDIPENLRKKFPKSYNNIPVTLLGRLAVDIKYRGMGIGGKILVDALKRSLSAAESSLGSVAVIVDPLDLEAENYYKHFGFVIIPDTGKMFLDMNTIKILDLN